MRHGDGLRALLHRLQSQVRARFIHDIDRFIGHMPIIDVPRSQLRGGAQRVVLVLDAVMLFVAGLQAAQNVDRVLHRGLRDVDFLEAPRQCMIFLEYAAVLVVGGRADAAQFAIIESRFD